MLTTFSSLNEVLPVFLPWCRQTQTVFLILVACCSKILYRVTQNFNWVLNAATQGKQWIVLCSVISNKVKTLLGAKDPIRTIPYWNTYRLNPYCARFAWNKKGFFLSREFSNLWAELVRTSWCTYCRARAYVCELWDLLGLSHFWRWLDGTTSLLHHGPLLNGKDQLICFKSFSFQAQWLLLK